MSIFSEISISDRQFFKQSIDRSGWIELILRKNDKGKQFELIERYKHLKLIVCIQSYNEYCPWGFGTEDIGILDDLNDIRGLKIASDIIDFSRIELFDQLETLIVLGIVGKGINNANSVLDLSRNCKLEYLALPTTPKSSQVFDFFNCKNLKYLYVPYLSDSMLQRYSSDMWSNNLEFLSLHRSTVSSFDAFTSLKKIKVLEVDYSKNLVDLSALSKCEELYAIDIQNCPGLSSTEFLSSISELIFLRMWNCKSLSSLMSLGNSKLECLDFYSSKVENGDLSFLDSCLKLKFLRYSNMRHYSRNLEEEIKERNLDLPSPETWITYKNLRV